MNKREIGELGEHYAEQFLISQDYRILQKNYHCRWGEVDIVAVSPQNELVFVEVKTRRSMKLGLPEASLTYRKVNRLIKTAMTYMMDAEHMNFRTWRIDLLALKLGRRGQLQDIKHFQSILYG